MKKDKLQFNRHSHNQTITEMIKVQTLRGATSQFVIPFRVIDSGAPQISFYLINYSQAMYMIVRLGTTTCSTSSCSAFNVDIAFGASIVHLYIEYDMSCLNENHLTRQHNVIFSLHFSFLFTTEYEELGVIEVDLKESKTSD